MFHPPVRQFSLQHPPRTVPSLPLVRSLMQGDLAMRYVPSIFQNHKGQHLQLFSEPQLLCLPMTHYCLKLSSHLAHCILKQSMDRPLFPMFESRLLRRSSPCPNPSDISRRWLDRRQCLRLCSLPQKVCGAVVRHARGLLGRTPADAWALALAERVADIETSLVSRYTMSHSPSYCSTHPARTDRTH